MKIISLLLGSILLALALVLAAAVVFWAYNIRRYAPGGHWPAFDVRLAAAAAVGLALIFGGYLLLRAGTVPAAVRALPARHQGARKRLEWDHVVRALVVANPTGQLLHLVETVPPVAQFILDQAYEGKSKREIYIATQKFLAEQSARGPLDRDPLPPVTSEMLSAAIIEACSLYPQP